VPGRDGVEGPAGPAGAKGEGAVDPRLVADLVQHLGAFEHLTLRVLDVEAKQLGTFDALVQRMVDLEVQNMEYERRIMELESAAIASRARPSPGPAPSTGQAQLASEVPEEAQGSLLAAREDRGRLFSSLGNTRRLRGPAPAIRHGSASPAPGSVSCNTHKHTLLSRSLSLSLSLPPSLTDQGREGVCSNRSNAQACVVMTLCLPPRYRCV
jgi:hypothetical protein